MKIFKINDYELPTPAKGLVIHRTPQISTQTNARGEMVAQAINERRLLTFEGLKWSYLDAETWNLIQSEIEKNIGELIYFDNTAQKWYKIQVLWGASSEQPYIVDESGKAIVYIDCTCSLTDMGYVPTEVNPIE